jgi:ATP-dependent RNA helicase DDX49/DBP8
MPALVKDFYLIYLILNKIADQPKMIFTPTCRKAHELALLLTKLGVEALPLHSMLKHGVRTANLRRFRKRNVCTLVCTDVAARGLDLPNVAFVVNYNLPREWTDYVHRVGRTARGGKRGTAITLLTQFDVERVLALET